MNASPDRRLPDGRTVTTAIGVGCAYLTEGLLRDFDRRIIDAAFDAGARHFDVAPSYGMGTAETVLGRALQGRRHAVTLASKVGVPRHEAGRLKLVLRSLAAPTRNLRRGLAPRAPQPSQRTLDFSVPYVSAMLAESLRRLRTDHLDAYLLHEVTRRHITDELLGFLERARRDGAVGTLGLATSRVEADAILAAAPGVFDIVQFSWSVLDPLPTPVEEQRFLIFHRALMGALSPLRRQFLEAPRLLGRLSEKVGRELADPVVLSATLVGAAVAANPRGIVLAASRTVRRTIDNVRSGLDPANIAAGERLLRAMVEESEHPGHEAP